MLDLKAAVGNMPIRARNIEQKREKDIGHRIGIIKILN